ncbi:MAG: hypothetical protein WC650_01820 [Candidatus Doudnabacteria bacterium]
MPARTIKLTVGQQCVAIPSGTAVIMSDIPGTANPEDVTDMGLSFRDDATVVQICPRNSTGQLGSEEKEIHTLGIKYQEGKIYLISSVFVRKERKKTKTYILTQGNIWEGIEECTLEEALSINIPELSLDQ